MQDIGCEPANGDAARDTKRRTDTAFHARADGMRLGRRVREGCTLRSRRMRISHELGLSV
jgi:hypothetical protein